MMKDSTFWLLILSLIMCSIFAFSFGWWAGRHELMVELFNNLK